MVKPEHVQQWKKWRSLADTPWIEREDAAPEEMIQALYRDWFDQTLWKIRFMGKTLVGELEATRDRYSDLVFTVKLLEPVDGVMSVTAPFEHFTSCKKKGCAARG